MIKENIGWQGVWQIKVIDKLTGEVKHTETLHNRIMNDALDEIIKALYAPNPDMELAYLAIGDSDIAIADSQTELDNEVFRTQFVSLDRTAVGEITALAIILDSDYDGQIEEIGIFAGSTAGVGAGSGLMISRILWSYTKTATEELQMTRIDKVVRG